MFAGRRTFLLLGAIIMTISVVILAAVTEPLNKIEKGPQCGDMAGTQKLHFHLLHPKVCTNTTQINSTSNLNIDIKNKNIFSTSVAMKNENCSATENDETIKTQVPGAVKYTCFIALMLFVIGYAVGYGPSMLISVSLQPLLFLFICILYFFVKISPYHLSWAGFSLFSLCQFFFFISSFSDPLCFKETPNVKPCSSSMW